MKRLLLFAFSVLAIGACGPTLKVTHDISSHADFSRYQTYAIYHPAGSKSPLSQLNVNRIDNGIISAMNAKGYTQTSDTGSADLLVNPVTIAKQGQNVTAYTDYYGYGGYYRPYYWGGGMGMMSSTTNYSVDKYVDGSLIIDVIDRNKRELLWQGIGNAQIDGPVKDPDTKIPEAISKIMASLPRKM